MLAKLLENIIVTLHLISFLKRVKSGNVAGPFTPDKLLNRCTHYSH